MANIVDADPSASSSQTPSEARGSGRTTEDLLGPACTAWQILETRWWDAQEHLAQLEAHYQRSFNPGVIPPYWMGLLFLTTLDIGLNVRALGALLREAPFFAGTLGTMVALVTVTAAHAVGKSMNDGLTGARKLLQILAFVALVGGLSFTYAKLSDMRVGYLDVVVAASRDEADGTLLSRDEAGAKTSNAGNDAVWWTLFALNELALLAGIVVSSLRHNCPSQLESATLEVERRRGEFEALEKQSRAAGAQRSKLKVQARERVAISDHYKALRSRLSLCLIALVAGSALLMSDSATAQEACLDGKPQRALILVDMTTRFDRTAGQTLRDGVRRIFDSLCPEDELVIYSITDRDTGSEKLLGKKVPGCRNRGVASTCDAAYSQVQRRELRKQVLRGLDKKVIASTRSLQHSAIAETFFETVRANGPFHAIYVSTDGFQNTDDCKFRTPSAAGCVYSMPPETLRHTRVTFFGIGRTDATPRIEMSKDERNQLHAFWRSILRPGGGDVRMAVALGSADCVR